MGYLEEGKRYQALSVTDLVEARDAYHVFLMRKKNVIGTAIGKYRMRKNGIDKSEPKTLSNTELRNYSWPCVLVFVENWLTEDKFGKSRGVSNDDFLPQRLYLPDGREIPVCVMLAKWKPKSEDPVFRMKFPSSVVGSGYPVMTRVQGEERWATLGCLVSDGRLTYGLTNAHVAGRPGEGLFTIQYGNEKEIGFSSQKQLKKEPFTDVYIGFAGKHTLLNLDIGLVELSNLQGVTSNVFGLGELKGIIDVNHDTLSLKLIACPVMGFGSASGLMKGEIVGLFYRYDTAGGYDYVADYLVGPRYDKRSGEVLPFAPMHGDSGTLLVIDHPKSGDHMKAIGVLWGGQKEISGTREQPYALVTNLGTVCRLLDVELVSNWNTAYDTYFGAYAHITLPSLCASAIKDEKLKQLMTNHASRFSMPLGDTEIKAAKGLSKASFVPLSDVPDLVWKKRGGRYLRGKEGPNHFANMDQPNPKDSQRTLLDLCKEPANIEPEVWIKYYEDIDAPDKGALPFRIAQIYDAMVNAVKKGKAAEYVCAAGILTHYVFDACMPMHISYLHHGDPNGLMRVNASTGKEEPMAYEVHEVFDNQLVEFYSKTLQYRLPVLVETRAQADFPMKLADIRTAKDAATAAVNLMRNTVEVYASPKAIVKDFEEVVDWKPRERSQWLWAKYGEGFLQAMAEAVVLAARLWEAAWIRGNGAQKIDTTDLVAEDDLKRLYEKKTGFLDSVSLVQIKNYMVYE